MQTLPTAESNIPGRHTQSQAGPTLYLPLNLPEPKSLESGTIRGHHLNGSGELDEAHGRRHGSRADYRRLLAGYNSVLDCWSHTLSHLLGGVELGSGLGVISQQLARFERLAVDGAEALHVSHQLGGRDAVHKPERAAGEGREAEPEHSADVALQLSGRTAASEPQTYQPHRGRTELTTDRQERSSGEDASHRTATSYVVTTLEAGQLFMSTKRHITD